MLSQSWANQPACPVTGSSFALVLLLKRHESTSALKTISARIAYDPGRFVSLLIYLRYQCHYNLSYCRGDQLVLHVATAGRFDLGMQENRLPLCLLPVCRANEIIIEE